MTVGSDWLTIGDACAYLHVTRATLYRWARDGRLRLFKVGTRATRVRRSDLDHLAVPVGKSDSWAALSGPAFSHDWDNEKDAAYDDWRERYGVREG
jgi:excisionase family DNA binding protein